MTSTDRRLAIATFLVAASAFLTPFRRDLFVGDETKYGEVVREMRASGTFFVPMLEGAPFTHKPPLHFWLIDALTFPLGVYSMWAFVLPSLLAFLALLWLMKRISGDWLSSFVCGTSLIVWASAQTARMDVSFTLFLTIGAWMLFRFFEHEERRALWLASIAFGIATLIKGPMAPVIALVLFGIEWWRRRRVPEGPRVGALLLMIVIPLLWFVPAVMLEGERFINEIVMKQTVGRAVGAWVHRSPPWFYIVRSPATLFPWFLLFVVALFTPPRSAALSRFAISWVLAVVVPYSLISSKLDIYMMALIPPVAIIVAEFVRSESLRVRNANLFMAFLLSTIGQVVPILHLKGEAAALLEQPLVQGVFFTMSITAAIAFLIIVIKRSAVLSTVLVGLVPIAVFVYVGIALMPLANEMATTRPLIRALDAQHVDGNDIALYTCPHLWSRQMPRQLETVHYVSRDNVGSPVVLATSRKYAADIAPALRGYRRVAEVQMIGKWFDVYRR